MNLPSEIVDLQRQLQQLDVLGDMQAKISVMMYRMEQLEKTAWRPPGLSATQVDLESRVSSLEVQMSDFLCCICLNAKREVVFNPCQHHVTCGNCCVQLLKKKSACPICRTTVESYLKLRG